MDAPITEPISITDDVPVKPQRSCRCCWKESTGGAQSNPKYRQKPRKNSELQVRIGYNARMQSSVDKLPQQHLKHYWGALHADGYAGFNHLYLNGEVIEVACWAHVRRKLYDVMQSTASPIATEAIERIAMLYAIEKDIRGKPPDHRKAVRQARATAGRVENLVA